MESDFVISILSFCSPKEKIVITEIPKPDSLPVIDPLPRDYQRNKNPKSLETLLAYNIQDVVNLEFLMVLSYNLKLKETPFVQSLQITFPKQPEILFKADKRIIEGIKRMRGYDMVWQSTHF